MIIFLINIEPTEHPSVGNEMVICNLSLLIWLNVDPIHLYNSTHLILKSCPIQNTEDRICEENFSSPPHITYIGTIRDARVM